MVAILIGEEIRRKKEEGGEQTPSYNMKTKYGATPLFCTKSSRAVELFLQINDDLHTTTAKGCPLLWRCAAMGIVTEKVASDDKVKTQAGQRWKGTMPLETGEIS